MDLTTRQKRAGGITAGTLLLAILGALPAIQLTTASIERMMATRIETTVEARETGPFAPTRLDTLWAIHYPDTSR